jgi:uncharacterized protein YkwD
MQMLSRRVLLGVVLCVACGPVDEDDGGGDDLSMPGDDGGDGGDGGSDEVPAVAYCDPVASWPAAQTTFEDRVVELVNAARTEARSCGGQPFQAAGPLAMNPALRCAARVHSLDMVVRGYFDHVNPDGEDPFDRMERAGYSFFTAAENIAAGQPTPEEVVAGWLDSPGHCANIMGPDFVHIGVGHVATEASPESGQFPHYWTQTFGAP